MSISARVWIGGLPEKITESQLREKFEVFGAIQWIRVRNSTKDVFAFIQYDADTGAEDAVREMDQSSEFKFGKDRVMKVSLAKPAPNEMKGGRGRSQNWGPRGNTEKPNGTRSGSRFPARSASRSVGRNRWSRDRSRSKDRRLGGGRRGGGSSRSRSLHRPPPRRDPAKGKSKGSQRALRVRIDTLPTDTTVEELTEIGKEFGNVVYAKVWSYQNTTFGNLLYEEHEEAMQAIIGLHGRRMSDWDHKLRAQICCPHCERSLWE